MDARLRASGDPILHRHLPSLSSGSRTKPGDHVAERGSLRLGFSEKFLQAGQGGARGLADPVLLAGAHRPRSKPSSGQLRTQKYPPRIGKEGGPEGTRASEDEERSPERAGSGHGSGAESEERGDPEVPRGAGGGFQPDLGAGRTSWRDREQSKAVQPAGGIWRSGFRQEEHPHPREILTDDEGSSGGNPEGGSAERNTPAGALSGSTRIANRNSLRDSG